MDPRFRRTGGLAVAAVLVAMGGDAGAGYVCEDINTDTIVVGELDYDVNSGADTCFANAYADGTTEFLLPWKAPVGGCPSTGSFNVGFYYFFLDDVVDDFAYVTFLMFLADDNDGVAGGEPNCVASTGEHSHLLTKVLNSADMPPTGTGCMDADCLVAVGRWHGVFGHACVVTTFRQWWLVRTGITAGDECTTGTDVGCFQVLPDCPGGSGNF